jgi:prepilin peptidase CpaA
MNAFELAAIVVTALAAAYDLKTGHIPNWLTFGSLIAAIGAHAIVGAAQGGAVGLGRGVGEAMLGTLVCGAVPAIVFFRGGMGGGDVKLFAALGASCSMRDGLAAQTYSFVIALLLVPAFLAYQGRLLRTLADAFIFMTNPLRPAHARRPTPAELTAWFRLAPAIFLGTGVMVYLDR